MHKENLIEILQGIDEEAALLLGGFFQQSACNTGGRRSIHVARPHDATSYA